MKVTLIWIILLVLCLSGCETRLISDHILSEKDLIPEGTAYNEERDILYIGCVNKQKIISLNAEGLEKEIIGPDKFGGYSPLGIHYDTLSRRLWVCAPMAPLVHQGQADQWETVVLAFDPINGTLIKQYGRLASQNPIFYNDITVANDGSVYVTESLNNRIFRIDPERDSMELFLTLKHFNFPNGITQSGKLLFVATDQGIIRIDQQSKGATLLKAKSGIDAGTIDGLEIAKDYFIGHQSSKVVRFYFNKEKTALTRSEVLDTGREFDSSTTGVINDGHYYFIVNSQIRSGIDQKTKTIKPMDSLENIIIRKIKL